MAEIAVGRAIGAGFGLIRRKPLAMLAWGLLLTLAFSGVAAAYVGFFSNLYAVTEFERAGAISSGAPSTEFFARALIGEAGIFTAFIVLMIVASIVKVAVWRAVLHPQEGRAGYLRVGLAELFNIAISMAVGFIANLAIFPLMPFLLLVGALVYIHQYVLAAIVGVLAVVAAIVGVIYLQLRFVLLGPMITDDGKIHFLEAWRLSRGKVGSLFLVGLGLVAMLFVAEVLLEVIVLAAGVGSLAWAAGGFDKLQGFLQQGPAVIAGRLWPFAAIVGIAAVPIAGCLTAILYAPWASAYRDLAPAPAAPTFA